MYKLNYSYFLQAGLYQLRFASELDKHYINFCVSLLSDL